MRREGREERMDSVMIRANRMSAKKKQTMNYFMFITAPSEEDHC